MTHLPCIQLHVHFKKLQHKAKAKSHLKAPLIVPSQLRAEMPKESVSSIIWDSAQASPSPMIRQTSMAC